MPGFDGTGPRGYGPGTGGGFGYCFPWVGYGYQNEGRWGGGRGWGRHSGRYGCPPPGHYNWRINPWDFQFFRPALKEEEAYLEELSRSIERQLIEIKKRLDEIKQKQAEEVDKNEKK